MTYEYRCPEGHEFEIFFRSFSEAEPHESSAMCQCGEEAQRIPSTPLEAHLYGNPAGYSKPSPTKRHSTKLVSALTGNKSSVG